MTSVFLCAGHCPPGGSLSKHDLQNVCPHFAMTGSEKTEEQSMQSTFFGRSLMKIVISSTVVGEGCLSEPDKESSGPVASLLWSEIKVRADVSEACRRCLRVALRAKPGIPLSAESMESTLMLPPEARDLKEPPLDLPLCDPVKLWTDVSSSNCFPVR